jgi:phosphoenolpyruvate carboxykinase (ATP)
MAEAQRACGLDKHGIVNIGQVHWDLSTPALYEQITLREEGVLAHLGPVALKSGKHTGRSPTDKFIVDDPTTRKEV